MAEYLNKYTIPSGSVFDIPMPGTVTGVYSDNPVSLEWVYNGVVGPIITGSLWEPTQPFRPMRTSYLRVTTTAQTTIAVRVMDE